MATEYWIKKISTIPFMFFSTSSLTSKLHTFASLVLLQYLSLVTDFCTPANSTQYSTQNMSSTNSTNYSSTQFTGVSPATPPLIDIATNISIDVHFLETYSDRKWFVGGHAYLIIVLSLVVLSSILFTLCGLFYKAEAHKTSDYDDGLLFSRQTNLISSFFDTPSSSSLV